MISEILSKINWLGHDAFRFDGDKVIYIDPFGISGGVKGDLILITHDHFDHCSPEDVAKIQHEKSVIVTEKDSARKLHGDIRVIRPGDTLDHESIRVEGVPAYNSDKPFHPRKNGWLGFVLEIQGTRIYHAGDSDFIPEMKNLHVDIALLPVSGTYVMTAEQAIQAALAIRPEVAIPMHYGAIVGGEEDALKFKKGLEGKIEVVILQKQG
jgi:L-ascorbate metabolism protein UlaG (beta-lactamase superfamily)